MKLIDVEGIGPDAAAKLDAAGVGSVEDFLAQAGSPAGRERLATATGLSSKLILEWANHADLIRIPGVGSEFADLLEAAGVDSPAELAQRNAANLAQTFQELDAARPNVVRRVPSQAQIEQWIAAAKSIAGAVRH
jgi:predicted flap endonuclease-1-like 5' DNA nuclease